MESDHRHGKSKVMSKITVAVIAFTLCTQAVTTVASAADTPSAPSNQPASLDIERGKNAWVMCGTCHGEQGQGMSSIGAPALGGQSAEYLKQQLAAYRSGLDPHDVQGGRMRMLALSIPDAALVSEVAAYAATFPAARSDRSVAGNIRSGQKTYLQHCISCHGDRAQGKPELNAPRISGLGDRYTLDQLRLFANGRRGSSPAGVQQMTIAARQAFQDEAAMRDVVAYLSSVGQ
jgi:cytochrome c oxidase subunit 2